MKIVFDPESHTYTHKDTGEKFISVTTLLSRFKKPFDKDKHSTRVAEREGVPKEMVLELWEKEKNKACERGTAIHELLEEYIKYGETADNYGWLFKSYDKAVERHIDKFKDVLSENLVYDETFKVSGTADLIYEHKDNEFTLGDFKTNKKFRFSSSFGERMLKPLDHFQVCEFNTYALQLSMYAYMYEKLSGKKCRKCIIFYLNDDRFSGYHVNYLKSDVEKLFKYYKLSCNNI